jgi:hypothetical protein
MTCCRSTANARSSLSIARSRPPRANRLNARMLVPLTRGHGERAALQFEVELTNLDQLDQFRNRGVGSSQETGDWMHAFSEILTSPPCVEILRIEDTKAT